MSSSSYQLRTTLRSEDRELVRRLTASSGFFNRDEVSVAVELVEEALAKGAERSGYHFRFVQDRAAPIAYACFGPIIGTRGRFDLFWIAVTPKRQGQGVGAWLLSRCELAMVDQGANRVYVETSMQSRYAPTRRFYANAGYHLAAVLPDFYAPGDGKGIFVKDLPA